MTRLRLARSLSRATLALLVLASSGCAMRPGTGFATLTGGRIAVAKVLGASRIDEAGRWKTNNSHQLRLDGGKLGIELRDVALQAPGAAPPGGGSGVAFDPAKPPPGYTLCHGNDCHRTDGSIVSYDEVRAELAGGGAAAPPKTVAALTPAAPFEAPLTMAAVWHLPGCTPHCFLPQGALSRAVVTVRRITATGTVFPPRGGEPRAWTLDMVLDGTTFAADVAADVSASGPAGLALTGTLTVTEKLFDGVPWERLLTSTGPVDLDADKETTETLLSNFTQSAWTAKLEPTP